METTILTFVSAQPLESNIDMVFVRVDELSHTVTCPHLCGQKRVERFAVMNQQQCTAQHQPGQQECHLMILYGILYHFILEHWKMCFGLF